MSSFTRQFCLFLGSVILSLNLAPKAFAVDLGQIEKDLNGSGLVGWIHGEVTDRELIVFTYRNPEDFFDNIQMSLIPETDELANALVTLGRHDQIRIKGHFMKNPSPQKHIKVTSVELVTKYKNPYAPAPYEHQAKLPADLETLDHGTFLVHAIGGSGHILVVEFKDQIVPIYVHDEKLTADLYRGDIVNLHFTQQKDPDQPTHLKLVETSPDALIRVQAIKDLQGRPATVEGALILFPQSPEIKFNVFAVEDTSFPGIKRQFTLLNQTDMVAFQKIREKLQAAWDRHPGAFVNGRNKLVSTQIRVRAKGVFQEIDPGQANAQVLLESADSLELIEQ